MQRQARNHPLHPVLALPALLSATVFASDLPGHTANYLVTADFVKQGRVEMIISVALIHTGDRNREVDSLSETIKLDRNSAEMRALLSQEPPICLGGPLIPRLAIPVFGPANDFETTIYNQAFRFDGGNPF